jgi:hypothetical protein
MSLLSPITGVTVDEAVEEGRGPKKGHVNKRGGKGQQAAQQKKSLKRYRLTRGSVRGHLQRRWSTQEYQHLHDLASKRGMTVAELVADYDARDIYVTQGSELYNDLTRDDNGQWFRDHSQEVTFDDDVVDVDENMSDEEWAQRDEVQRNRAIFGTGDWSEDKAHIKMLRRRGDRPECARCSSMDVYLWELLAELYLLSEDLKDIAEDTSNVMYHLAEKADDKYMVVPKGLHPAIDSFVVDAPESGKGKERDSPYSKPLPTPPVKKVVVAPEALKKADPKPKAKPVPKDRTGLVYTSDEWNKLTAAEKKAVRAKQLAAKKEREAADLAKAKVVAEKARPVAAIARNKANARPESAQPTSSIISMELRHKDVAMGFLDGEMFSPQGQCFRVGNYLVGAKHVWNDSINEADKAVVQWDDHGKVKRGWFGKPDYVRDDIAIWCINTKFDMSAVPSTQVRIPTEIDVPQMGNPAKVCTSGWYKSTDGTLTWGASSGVRSAESRHTAETQPGFSGAAVRLTKLGYQAIGVHFGC